jgi:DNA-binding NtrC family response regulator
MRGLLDTAGKVAGHDVNILLLGESGSGKDYLAEALHACGPRRDAPFVAIDCASIPAELFESELFGYEKGTFTDASSRKIGRLEAAGRGTVYFDEIAALSPALQAKLLRAMQDRSFTRLGGGQTVELAARVMSSSSADPATLRRDLLYRINVVTLRLPPLRERMEDLAALARRFLARRKRGVRGDAMALLRAYHWPGNVRELRNVIERAAIVEESDLVTPASLPPLDGDLVATALHARWTLEQLEIRYITEVLRQTRSSFSKAAEVLGINRKTLLEKRRKYGLP